MYINSNAVTDVFTIVEAAGCLHLERWGQWGDHRSHHLPLQIHETAVKELRGGWNQRHAERQIEIEE
jgi:uncharacterized membrane protein (DUF2068 family)